MKYYVILFFLIPFACEPVQQRASTETATPILLTRALANKLVELPLKCIEQQWPNKLNQILSDSSEMDTPKKLHPVFYGCFDWHSAVHGYWSMVALIKRFPDLDRKDEVLDALNNLSAESIAGEIAYFERSSSAGFERTYGWAWLLKLAEELHTWDDPLARKLEHNLMSLTQLIVQKYLEFLPKLYYPIRTGEHPNTAFGMNFALDYALAVNNDELKSLLVKRAKDFYGDDKNGPLSWEPNGFDFLSPCLEEANLMRKVLPADEFKLWLNDFLPKLVKPDFTLETGIVTDRTDGKLVHLDGLNFSRAWCLRGVLSAFSEYGHLSSIANEHIDYSLPNLAGDSYEGGHWLGSFAIYALIS